MSDSINEYTKLYEDTDNYISNICVLCNIDVISEYCNICRQIIICKYCDICDDAKVIQFNSR